MSREGKLLRQLDALYAAVDYAAHSSDSMTAEAALSALRKCESIDAEPTLLSPIERVLRWIKFDDGRAVMLSGESCLIIDGYYQKEVEGGCIEEVLEEASENLNDEDD